MLSKASVVLCYKGIQVCKKVTLHQTLEFFSQIISNNIERSVVSLQQLSFLLPLKLFNFQFDSAWYTQPLGTRKYSVIEHIESVI